MKSFKIAVITLGLTFSLNGLILAQVKNEKQPSTVAQSTLEGSESIVTADTTASSDSTNSSVLYQIALGLQAGAIYGGLTVPLKILEPLLVGLDKVADNVGESVRDHLKLAGEFSTVTEGAYFAASATTSAFYIPLVYYLMLKLGAGRLIAGATMVIPSAYIAGNILGFILSHQATEKEALLAEAKKAAQAK